MYAIRSTIRSAIRSTVRSIIRSTIRMQYVVIRSNRIFGLRLEPSD